ncbi:TetR/AcrR family transcriptional regulator [Acidisphaera sp. L21]|uniref:TetR/AcrR family transcriptional regulator n=1 Tax=Acidisphaera sp. L21 TaxID=1641851 RepID=UPI00131CF300|nr:TetR/AcrR family transcriptional regulator [Acidisphaera sp. L21]
MSNAALHSPKPHPAHERIVEAARDLFCRQGIHATGIDTILAAAGASKMTLYGRFGSKDALLREVLSREGADWREVFFAAVTAAADNPLAQLTAIPAALDHWYQGGRLYGCAFMNAIAEHDKTEQWLRQITADHHRMVLAFFAGLATQAQFAEPEILARQLLLLIDGANAALMVTNDPSVLEITQRNLDAVLAMARRTCQG